MFGRPGTIVTTLMLAVLGAAFLTQVVPYRQILDSQRKVSAAKIELARLEEDNARLAAAVAAMHTDAEIEKLAREKLAYVRPGETAYVVLDPPEDQRRPAPPPVADELPEEQTWVDQVWDFLTGADIES